MNIRSTDRFVEDGQGLDFWLWELICDDLDRRDRAAEVIERMRTDLTDEIIEEHRWEFKPFLVGQRHFCSE